MTTGNERESDIDRECLRQLAAFAPVFRDRGTVFSTSRGGAGSGSPEDPLVLPWFENSAVAERFSNMLYQHGWILKGFDWGKWAEGPEGKLLLENRDAVASANGEQLAKTLTTLVRSDRFCDGALAEAFDENLLLYIVERAECLLDDH